MKKALIICLLLVLGQVFVFAQQYYGRVVDPDGYTNVRRGPSTGSAIVTQYSAGTYIYYTPQSNGWSKVYYSNSSRSFVGYMHTSRIQRVNNSMQYGKVVDPDGYTNVRSGPSTNYSIVRQYSSGSYIYYVPQRSGWSMVYDTYGNFVGYMHTSRIRRVTR